ncbi:MAG: RDD family protein [Breznakibacter sp.]|nr:RDD family protein [Breznakibacter sp.]
MENIKITTAQNVLLNYRLASFGDRILAYLIDIFIVGSLTLLIVFLLSMADSLNTAIALIIALPGLFYHLLCEFFFNGQSLGKMAIKIRVEKIDGQPLTFGSCFLRWLLRLVDFTLSSGSVAVLTILITGKGQRLGDMAAGTTVVKIDDRPLWQKTIYETVPADYQPVYDSAMLLTDAEVQTIKDVLELAKNDRDYSAIGAPFPLAIKMRDAIAKKLNVTPQGNSIQFLQTILTDYNHFNQ